MLIKTKSKLFIFSIGAIILIALVSSCSSTRYVGDDEFLLKKNIITCYDKSFDVKSLEPYYAQRPNSKWFSLFKIPLGIYNMSGRDTTKWINRTIRRIGESPVILDPAMTESSCKSMIAAMKSMGYLKATASYTYTKNGKKAINHYEISPGVLYKIDSVDYVIEDEALKNIIRTNTPGLKRGMDFSNANLDAERKRLTQSLLNNGYYKFNKDFIHYVVDTLGKNGKVDVELHIIKFRASNNSEEESHKQYFINNIQYKGGDNKNIPLRSRVLENNTAIQYGMPFSAAEVQETYNNFARLQAIKYTNIHFYEVQDSLLDCEVTISPRKPNSISFQPEGTNTAGDFGAAASLTYTNNNLFHGSEVLSVQLRGAFEAITGLEDYKNEDYEEYGIEARLGFPRLIAPFLSKNFRRKNRMKSELMFSYNLQNRPEFHRRVLTTAWRYHWNILRRKTSYRFDLLDINYVQMPWISATFKKEYLDNVNNRNAILRYNYEDLFILRTGLNFTYSDSHDAVRSNLELGGNILNAISHMAKLKKNANGQYTLFNIAYAQYVKCDFDYTHLTRIDYKNTLAFHLGFGIAYPYGNSNILPFEKRYFSGGSNSVRGWNVRGLGPGKFKGNDGRIDFINQTGDMKLDINMELRTFLFWKFNCAFFIDAGNIWTLKNYKDQEGGQFKFNEFYKQIAVAYGMGIRLNFDYFIMRVDFGMKAINPAYDNDKEHFPVTNPNLKRDLAIHFAVGMPF